MPPPFCPQLTAANGAKAVQPLRFAVRAIQMPTIEQVEGIGALVSDDRKVIVRERKLYLRAGEHASAEQLNAPGVGTESKGSFIKLAADNVSIKGPETGAVRQYPSDQRYSKGIGKYSAYKLKMNATSSGAQDLADEAIAQHIMAFLHNPANSSFLTDHHRSITTKYNSIDADPDVRLDADGVIRFNTGPGHKDHAAWLAKNSNWKLTEAGRDKFDREQGINRYVAPAVGDAYAMATQNDAPDFHEHGQAWSQHWGAIVLQTGADRITLDG